MTDDVRGASRKTTLILADDHPAMLAGTRLQLQQCEAVCIVGEAADGKEAFKLIGQHRPDVAVVDFRMPLMGGLALLKMVRDHGYGTELIIFSATTDAHLVQKALDLGAAGYVSKSAPVQQIVDAVRAVAAGGRYIDPTLLAQLLQEGSSRLSVREHEVLQLAANGMQNKEIAQALDVGIETVKSHLSSAMRKLQANSRTGAVAAALRQSVID